MVGANQVMIMLLNMWNETPFFDDHSHFYNLAHNLIYIIFSISVGMVCVVVLRLRNWCLCWCDTNWMEYILKPWYCVQPFEHSAESFINILSIRSALNYDYTIHDIYTLLGCLWPLVFVLNNTLILGIWCSTIPHLPGCFCPWTFF